MADILDLEEFRFEREAHRLAFEFGASVSDMRHRRQVRLDLEAEGYDPVERVEEYVTEWRWRVNRG